METVPSPLSQVSRRVSQSPLPEASESASRSSPALPDAPRASADDDDEDDDEDDGYCSSAEQSPPASHSSSRSSSSSSGHMDPRPHPQRFPSLAEDVSGDEGAERCCAKGSSSSTLVSLATLRRESCLSPGPPREELAAGSDTHTNGDDQPSADAHPLPMCNSDSCSAAPRRVTRVVRRSASSGVETRRKKRMGNTRVTTVSGLLDVVGGSGAVTSLGHTTPALLNHNYNSNVLSHADSDRLFHGASDMLGREESDMLSLARSDVFSHVNSARLCRSISAGRNTEAQTLACESSASPLLMACPSLASIPPIGGHHMVIQQNGVFMKESCSRREERFYEMLRRVQEFAARNPEIVCALRDGKADSEETMKGFQEKTREETTADTSAHATGGSFGDFPAEAKRGIVLMRLLPFLPRFYGVRRVCFTPAAGVVTDAAIKDNLTASHIVILSDSAPSASVEAGDVRQMIVLEDLCNGFLHPCILDIKMGSRQYGMNPSEKKLLSKERKSAMTTSMQYGVRLAGMKRWCGDRQQYETKSKITGRFLTLEELQEDIHRFAQSSEGLLRAFREQVSDLRQTFERQRVFRFFTSSLLFLYDADAPLRSARVVMVDFAYTYERDELQRGGDPDADKEFDVGYIKALDTLQDMLALRDPCECGK